MQVYRVVSLGQEVYFGNKRTEAIEAFNELKESADMWSVNGKVVALLSRKVRNYAKIQDVARYKA